MKDGCLDHPLHNDLWWRPAGDDVAMFYVVASCMGLCDAIWQTQANSKQS